METPAESLRPHTATDRLEAGGAGSAVVSPFAAAEAAVPPESGPKKRVLLWAGLALLLVVAGLFGGIAVTGYLHDPLRTLEPFPAAKYLENYRALSGVPFRARMSVEADLGWKEGIGRLMLFGVEGEPRPVAVLIPASVGTIYFTKGQTYLAKLEVGEGGLVVARSCKKE
jgi:hypothetical protein